MNVCMPATSTFLLPRLIGHSRASSLLLSGEVVSPSSPLVEALYYRTFPTREEVFPAAFEFAQELSTRTSQVAVAYTKGLLQHPGDTAEENHLLDSRSIRLLASGKDGGEGVQSFKERRQPKFTDTLSRNSSTWYPWVRVLHLGGSIDSMYLIVEGGPCHPSTREVVTPGGRIISASRSAEAIKFSRIY
jgi:hypothetical protein